MQPNDTDKKPRAKRRKTPKHRWETRVHKVRLAPTPAQEKALWHAVHGCWLLRNQLVVDRQTCREHNRELKAAGVTDVHYLTKADQFKAIPGYVALYPEQLAGIHSQVLQNVADRVDKGDALWHKAIQAKRRNVRAPHPIKRKNYRSITFPQYGNGARLSHGHLFLSGIGEIKTRDWRKMRGQPKTVTVKFEDGHWWGLIACALQAKDIYAPMDKDDARPDGCGDPGLSALLTDSEGTKHDPPKSWHEQRRQLASALRDMARKFRARENQWKEDYLEWIAQGVKPPVSLKQYPYSNRLREQIRQVGKLYTKVKNVRSYWHEKIACIISDTFRLFGIEEHELGFMLHNRRLAKLAHDRAIGEFKGKVAAKMGPRAVKSPNRDAKGRGNSQTCTCGEAVPKELGDRVHVCPACGLVADRDHVAANRAMLLTFGYVSVSLSKAAGLAATGRGGTEARASSTGAGESRDQAAPGASEGPAKRQPQAEPGDERPRKGNRTRQAKPAGGRRQPPRSIGKRSGDSRGGRRCRRAPEVFRGPVPPGETRPARTKREAHRL